MVINTANLVSAWKADKAGEFKDSKGTNHGTINGAQFTVDGKIAGCYSFDGSNDDMTVSGLQNHNYSDDFTISMWVNPVNFNNQYYLYYHSDSGSSTDTVNFRILDSNSIRVYLRDSGSSVYYIDTSDTLPTTWFLITIIWDNSANNIDVYVNNTLQNKVVQSSGTISTVAPNQSLILGSYGNSSYYYGLMDDINLWNTALSSSEITELYNSGTGKTYNPDTDAFEEPNTLANGLVSYWKFDGDATDEISGNDGTVNGATVTSSGKIGGAYDFDGTDDKITVPNPIGGLDSFTISLWTNLDDLTSGDDGVIGDWDNGNDRSLIFFKDDSGASTGSDVWRIIIQTTSSSYELLSDNAATTGSWIHLLITYDRNNEATFCINGVQEDSIVTGDYAVNVGYTNLEIGNTGGGRWYNGKIDEPAIWGRTLSSTEITELYNSGSGKQYPFTVVASGYANPVNGVSSPSSINGILADNIAKVNGV